MSTCVLFLQKRYHIQDLPEVGLDKIVDVSMDNDAVHIYAHPKDEIIIHRDGKEQVCIIILYAEIKN